ncbi:MAG: xanthine permease XanP [Halieaceae bacterium]|jgi:xanthine permease XanP
MITLMSMPDSSPNVSIATDATLLYGLDDNPPVVAKFLAAFQHLLAIFVSIITAPLLICIGMGLDARETSYMISSALVISGVATFIQVRKIGPLGSGLLSIQGTSFTFIGPLIFAAHSMRDQHSSDEILGIVFGCTMVGALMMMVLSQFLHRLRRVITPTVTGTAVIVLGLSLIMVTVDNLIFEYNLAREAGSSAWLVPAYAVGVVVAIIFAATRTSPWLRLSSVSIGLLCGYLVALSAGQIDFSPIETLPTFFYPQPLIYEIGFEWGIFLSLLPIYLVTAAESIGDLTATSNLSGQPVSGPSYWARIRGGVLGDGFNSLVAAIFNTFPNTTFSQNNGVIRLTGVASRPVGIWLAIMLIVMGTFPVLGGLFQVMPKGLLYGATVLMFALVGYSGVQIITGSGGGRRAWLIMAVALGVGLLATLLPKYIENLSPIIAMLLGFPVSTSTICAIVLELVLPRTLWKQEVVNAG